MPKVCLVTRYWGGLGLAMLIQRQGSQVVCAFDYTAVKPKELKATAKIGDGLVAKMSLEQALHALRGQGTLWVFDGNDLPREADRLREQGEQVIGTSVLSQKLEDDREFAAEMAEQVGFDLPTTEKFTDYEAAIQYLEQHQDQAFVFKPDKQDPTATYVPLEQDDTAKANDELQEYIKSLPRSGKPSFILQEVVNGIEANFEVWVSHGQPLIGFCDLESKRKLVGDLGENLGCAGDYVTVLPRDNPALRTTVLRYLSRPELHDYTGSVDANVMLKDGKVYFLENCFRFGYNAYATIAYQLATQPFEALLRAWVAGEDVSAGFRDGWGASLMLVCDHPKDGTPILIPPDVAQDVYLYRTYCETDHCAMVEEWSEVAAVTAWAPSMSAAGQACLERAKAVAFPGKGYRIDLANEELRTLPIPRAQALERMGWLPGTNDDEEAITALLGALG